MLNNYTQFIENYLDNIDPDDLDTADIADLDILKKEYSRKFCDGLTQLLVLTGYNADPTNIKEKCKYVYSHLHKIGKENDESFKRNLRNWLNDKEIPTQPSRESIFELCFALSASLEIVQWFFNHVYFYRSFDCHDIKEAVYYYCFKNNLDYFYAQSLIQEIKEYPISKETIPVNNPFTSEIRDDINRLQSEKEFKNYFKKNRHFFVGYRNQKAKENICDYLGTIRGTSNAREIVDSILAGEYFNSETLEACGLVIYEKFIYIQNEYGNELCEADLNEPEMEALVNSLKNTDLTSISFMLSSIYQTPITKKNLNNLLSPKIAKNFPSEKIFSNLLNSIKSELNIDTTENYDAIRKCLILLKFYHFWCRIETRLETNYDNDEISWDDLYKIYINDTNDLLTECAYDELFPGNTYDRLFMYCAKCSAPLAMFREFISQGTTT